MPSDHERVPVEPFVRFLSERLAFYEAVHGRPDGAAATADGLPPLSPAEQLAAALGWSGEKGQRRLYRYRHALAEGVIRDGVKTTAPAESFGRAVVQDAIEHAGFRFYDVYPELEAADDVELEADAYCSSCHDVVTPIEGMCPWCERPTDGRVPDRRYCPREDAMRYAAVDGNCWRCGSKLHPQSPMVPCACGCGTTIRRFAARTGREVRYVPGHAPRSLERKKMVPVEPFAVWLENELRNLDPIQALARRTGLGRDTLLDILGRRVDAFEFERVRNALWRASREGQGGSATNGPGRGMPPRPGAARVRDLYPEHVRSTTCPDCGGRKSAHAERCRTCNTRLGRPRMTRPSSVTPELVELARRLRDTERLSFVEIAERIQPRTRCKNPESVKGALLKEFRERGWDTSRIGRSERVAA